MDSVSSLLISCFTWSSLYFILCLTNPRRSYEWHIRTVTMIHAITVSILGVYGILVLGPWPFTNAGGPSTPFQHFVITISLAYFLLDFSWCLYFRTEGPVMLVHHSMSIAGLTACFIMRWWGTELITTMLGAEITNPLLQLRWFLRETNRYDSLLGDVVDIAFMVLFGVFRIGIGSYLLYCYYLQDTTDFLGRLGGTLIYSIGWVFWFSIVQYGIKKYKKRYAKRAKADKRVQHNSENGLEVDKVLYKNNKTEVNGNIDKKLCKNGINGDIHKRKITVNHMNGL